MRGMSYNFKRVDRETAYLMPPSVKEWLPEGHLAWFILGAVAKMNLGGIRRKYQEDGWGQAAYEPEMMTALLLYAYSIGRRSSREIEKSCHHDVAFRVIVGDQRPDYSTICRFRARNWEEIKGLFTQTLRLCVDADLVDARLLAVDGTKIKASAAKSANRKYEDLKEIAEKVFKEAERVDAEEDELYGKDKRGDELPEHLNTREKQEKWLAEQMERINGEAREKAAKQAEKIIKRAEEEWRTGKKKRGRKPAAPDPTPDGELKLNMTDPESRLMKTREGYVQGYNAQAVVTEDQIIVAAEVTQEANDVGQLHPMLGRAREELASAGVREKPKKLLADAGYWSEANAKKRRGMPELFIATNKDWKQRKAMREAPAPRGRMRADMTGREKMERKLLTKAGRATYKLRGQTIEPVFGQVKDARGCDRFMRRGLRAASSEWSLMCATHNLLKLWRSGKAKLCGILASLAPRGRDWVPSYA